MELAVKWGKDRVIGCLCWEMEAARGQFSCQVEASWLAGALQFILHLPSLTLSGRGEMLPDARGQPGPCSSPRVGGH